MLVGQREPDYFFPAVFDLQQAGLDSIRTSSVPPEVVFDASGLWAVDGANVDTFRLRASDGSAFFKGAVQTGSTVPATTVTGQLTDAQLASLSASKVLGQLTDSQIAALAAAKLTGQIVNTQIADDSISTPKLQAGAVVAAKIAVTQLDAISANMGTLTAGQIRTSATNPKIVLDASTAQLTKTDAAGNVAVAITQTDGLDLLAGVINNPPNDRRIRWLDGGTSVVDIFGSFVSGLAELRATAAAKVLSDTAVARLVAVNSNVNPNGQAALELYNTPNTPVSQWLQVTLGARDIIIANDDGTSDFMPVTAVAFPANPYNGQEVFLTVDSTNGVVWHFKYDAFASGSYKWRFVGGPPLFNKVDTDQSITSLSYANLATVGPQITLPFAGDYDVEIGLDCTHDASSSVVQVSFSIGATAANDNESIEYYSGSATGPRGHFWRKNRITGVSASTALVMKYKVSSGTGHAKRRTIHATPVRCG